MHLATVTAEKAGELILEVYGEDDFNVSLKSDNTPLTQADLMAHQYILTALEAETEYPVLSEESTVIDWDIRRRWSTYWLIDPLDGTKEFVDRNDEFTVNIALIHNNKPIIGVVVAPALGISYQAGEGLGAYKISALQKTIIEPRSVPVINGIEKMIVVIGRCSYSQRLEQLFDRLPSYEIIRLGSSLKMCHIAEGKADLYPRHGNICEWDTAAAHCVLNCVGGDITTLSSSSLRYNKKNSLLNPEFFAWADPNIPWSHYG